VEESHSSINNETRPRDGEAAERLAREANQASVGLVREFFDFLRHNKKWWLAPIIIILLLVGVLVLLSGTAVAPFIYTIF